MAFPWACSICSRLDARRSPCKCELGLPTVYGIKGKQVENSERRQLAICEAGIIDPDWKPREEGIMEIGPGNSGIADKLPCGTKMPDVAGPSISKGNQTPRRWKR